MTEQIKILESFKETFTGTDNINAIDIAINSLQSWEEVLNELEQRVKTFSKLCDRNPPCMHYEDMKFAYMNCINIINQKLAEIKGANKYD